MHNYGDTIKQSIVFQPIRAKIHDKFYLQYNVCDLKRFVFIFKYSYIFFNKIINIYKIYRIYRKIQEKYYIDKDYNKKLLKISNFYNET